MSDIPSALSRWEPSRTIKVAFLYGVIASFLTLFGAKLYQAWVVEPRLLETSMGAERRDDPAPPLALKDAEGRTVSLEALRGKVVFVNFWATWCEPCRDEMPSLATLAKSVHPEDVVFLAVSVDETWAPIDGFLGKDPLPYRVVLDPDQATSKLWGTTGLPESFVVGRDGNLLYKFVGPRDWGSVAALRLLERAGARRNTARFLNRS